MNQLPNGGLGASGSHAPELVAWVCPIWNESAWTRKNQKNIALEVSVSTGHVIFRIVRKVPGTSDLNSAKLTTTEHFKMDVDTVGFRIYQYTRNVF